MIRAIAIALLACLLASPARAAGILRIIGWNDYIDGRVLDDFQKTTGLTIVYDTYNSSEDLESRLAARDTAYDVVILSAQPLERGIASGFYRVLDRSKLRHAGALLPGVMARLAEHDPGNAHAVNYMWFATGIAYDIEKAKARLGGAAPESLLASWNAVFDPAIANRFADCGIAVRDSAQDLFADALTALKFAPASKRPADYTRAASLLFRIGPSLTFVAPDSMPASLAGGGSCLAVANGSEVAQARERAAGASPPIVLGFVIPKEGALIWLDNLAIPKNARRPDDAYRFIDYLLEPEIAARDSAATRFANSVGAKPLPPDFFKGAVDDASAPALQNLFTLPIDPAIDRLIGRYWTRLKSFK